MTIGLGAIGVGMLFQAVRRKLNEDEKDMDPWQRIQSQCMQQAHGLLRRKNCPIEIRYSPGRIGLPKVRICLYNKQDLICAIPAGGINGDSVAVLEADQRCALRPRSNAESFIMRVFKPGLIDMAMNE